MTTIQERAIQMIKNMPDDKIKALIALAEDEFTSLSYKQKSGIRDKREAFARPEK